MKKRDGHTHSEFCRHGSGDKTALMIEKAIRSGFTHYTVAEHAPLPEGIVEDPRLQPEFSLMPYEVEDYFRHVRDLKKEYGGRIRILSALEADYISGHEDHIAKLLKDHRSQLDDLIISIHFLKGSSGYSPIDFSPEIFERELIAHYGSADEVHRVYWREMRELASMKLDFAKPARIGHIGLIYKYSLKYPVSSETFSISFFERPFRLIKDGGWELDWNAAGLSQKHFRQVYLTEPMLHWCRKLKIKLVYGSDAHGVESIGNFYDRFTAFRDKP